MNTEGFIEENESVVKGIDGKVYVSKSYKRSVNLSPITTQYDRIELSTYAGKTLDNVKHVDTALGELYSIVYGETEKDIESTFIDLAKKTQDPKKQAFVGIIPTEPIESKNNKIEDSSNESKDFLYFDDDEPVVCKKEKLEKPIKKEVSPDNIEEVDLDGF